MPPRVPLARAHGRLLSLGPLLAGWPACLPTCPDSLASRPKGFTRVTLASLGDSVIPAGGSAPASAPPPPCSWLCGCGGAAGGAEGRDPDGVLRGAGPLHRHPPPRACPCRIRLARGLSHVQLVSCCEGSACSGGCEVPPAAALRRPRNSPVGQLPAPCCTLLPLSLLLSDWCRYRRGRHIAYDVARGAPVAAPAHTPQF